MKKVTVTIQETVRYEDEVTIEVPEEMTEREFENILDSLERKYRSDSSKDVAWALEKTHGFKVVEQSYSFPDAPYDHELEITDYDMENEE